MRILITYEEIMENHDWNLFCSVMGYDFYMISEGQKEAFDIESLSLDSAIECGILPEGANEND